LRRAIEDYYHQTWLDYRGLWTNSRNLAFHFGYYDDTTTSHAQALANTNRILAERAGVKPGERVLDAGCGVGGSSQWLARERGARVVGINLVRRQLAEARRFARRRGLSDRVSFVPADFTRLPFAPASFDVVWAVESLCHAADKGAFYREVSRVLRPGGRLVVAEYMRNARPLDAPGEERLASWLSGWAIPDLDTRNEHERHVSAAELAGLDVADFTPVVRRSLRRLYRIAAFCMPFGAVGRVLRLRTPTQHANTRAAAVQYTSLRAGDWFYGVLVARKPALSESA
jgi:tocopherol O-methyltransferase